jgi:hypothetical protein
MFEKNPDDWSTTYNPVKLVRVPIVEGISPVNSFPCKSLEINSENKSLINYTNSSC